MKIYIEAQKLRVENPSGEKFELMCIEGRKAYKTKESCYASLSVDNSMILELTVDD